MSENKKGTMLCQTNTDAKGIETTLYVVRGYSLPNVPYYSLTDKKSHASLLNADEVKKLQKENSELEEAK